MLHVFVEDGRVANARDEETTPETLNDAGGETGKQAERRPELGFVVVWSSDEPDILGAWLPVAAAGSREPRMLGRGPARSDDEHPRISLLRQRPEHNELLPPLGSEALSRSQLLFRPVGSERLEVVNRGRRKISLNGALQDECEVGPGDVLEVGNRLALFCTTRPLRLAGSAASPGHAFGVVDALGVVGESPAVWRLRTDIAFAAQRGGHVLILGATGTGKELVAGALHSVSGRPGALVSRNAATLPESLVDAELFGNAKGYPNPGFPEREGLIGAAHRGSLFLDEFADLPSGAQAHVLRVLDAGDYQRLGESQQRRSEFRLIAATNRPESSLRADLLARFDFRIRVPPLSARREDIPLILRHLFALVARDEPDMRERFALPDDLPRVSPGFIQRLVQHPFASNVRELRHLLWRALAESPGNALTWPEHDPSLDTSAEDEEGDPPHAEIQR
ncbi:MAG TPA: sigma 54-interacting transcriptional regulator, partial [Polyangiaceae bacterium]